MKVRTLAFTAALATASAVTLAPPASAQTRGGITLSFGTGGYNSYDYDYDYEDDDDYPTSSYYTYSVPQYRTYYNYSPPDYAWQAWARREQIERWRAEQQRRQYWEHERREHQHWHDRDDDDD